VTDGLDRLATGAAVPEDVETVAYRLRTVTDGNRCYLPVQEQRVVGSIISTFADEVNLALDGRPLPRRGFVLPKLVDLAGGVATYDERQALKQPDWTYVDPPGSA
jgi:NADH-quinone oxidoreductase subunit F